MRKLIYAINLTADGCCDHTKGIGSEDLHDYFTGLLRDIDTLVYGRITWQLMFPFWSDMAKSQSGPTRSLNEFATAFDSVGEVVVFSRSIDQPDNGKYRVSSSDLREEILSLKNREGKDILTGGVDIPSQLVKLGLVDEMQVVIQPTIAGEGRRLFDDLKLAENLPLKLSEAKILDSGGVVLRYEI